MWSMRSKTELCELNFYAMHFAGKKDHVSPACLFGLRRISTGIRHRFCFLARTKSAYLTPVKIVMLTRTPGCMFLRLSQPHLVIDFPNSDGQLVRVDTCIYLECVNCGKLFGDSFTLFPSTLCACSLTIINRR